MNGLGTELVARLRDSSPDRGGDRRASSTRPITPRAWRRCARSDRREQRALYRSVDGCRGRSGSRTWCRGSVADSADGAPSRREHTAGLPPLREAPVPPVRRGPRQADRALRLQLPAVVAADRARLLRRARGSGAAWRCGSTTAAFRPRRLRAGPASERTSAASAGFVYGSLVDTLRRVSRHVSVGSAARHGREIGSWFVLVRED